MKITFVECAQNFGGARKAVIRMATTLSSTNSVEIIDTYGNCDDFVNACKSSSIPFSVLCDRTPVKLRTETKKIKKFRNYLLFIPHVIKIGRKLSKQLDNNNVDYVCVSQYRPLLMLLFRHPKAEVIYFAHAWHLNKQIARWERFLLKKVADKIVCISEATRHAIYNDGIAELKNLFVVPNCIDEKDTIIPPAKLEGSENKVVILHCGGFTEGKGQHISLKLAEELKKRNVLFKLIFTGIVYTGGNSQKYLDQLRFMVKTHNLEDDVEFIVDNPNVYDYIRACDILIHPSATEGFPLVVLEAQIMKKAVIANAVGGVTDMIIHGFTGFLPSYNDVDEYANIIQKLVADKSLYDFVTDNAYNMVKHCYTPEQQEIRLRNVFSK